ncbi:MAG: LON peptidase substrate-binding domain-containing protein [Acidobacteria bacterium]|nr:LON peptidase substrate-binding domain-containing protein [Acidobacteriota bacterium]
MSDAVRRLPVFPLGSVLLPGMILPLHVFEERYRVLVADVLAADVAEFGVTLIERGSEVGGGDVRADVGCLARVLEAAATDDGRWALVTVGTEPFAVEEWLPDDPYPCARISSLEDLDLPPADAADRLVVLAAALRRCAALATELGASGSVDVELSEDPWLATFQAAVLAPIGALDRQRVLRTRSAVERLALVEELVAEQSLLLDGRLRLGSPDDPGPLG